MSMVKRLTRLELGAGVRVTRMSIVPKSSTASFSDPGSMRLQTRVVSSCQNWTDPLIWSLAPVQKKPGF